MPAATQTALSSLLAMVKIMFPRARQVDEHVLEAGLSWLSWYSSQFFFRRPLPRVDGVMVFAGGELQAKQAV